MALDLGVAASHGVSGFLAIITEIAVDGLDGFCVLSFEVTRLVLGPDKTGGNGRLGHEAVDITDLGDYRWHIRCRCWYGVQSARHDLELLFNSLVPHLDLAARNMAMVTDMG